MKRWVSTAAASALLAFGAGDAEAGAVITTGATTLGVNDQGHLNFFGTNEDGITRTFGIFREGLGDAIEPGCLCEGWGVAATTTGSVRIFANASIDNGGIDNLGSGTFGSTPNTATSIVPLTNADLEVSHRFGPSLAPDIFQVAVTLENTGAAPLEDVVYRRTMDWDVPPTEFFERVTHFGVDANLESNGGNIRFASDNGFADSNPEVPAGSILPGTTNQDFVDSGPEDHGSVFDFAFGDLAAGEQRNFNIFYGSAPDEPTAEARVLGTLQANAYSFGQQSVETAPDGQPATFIFAFGGVGGVPPGSDPSNPVLPFVPAPGEFVFEDPEPRLWFDPPFVDTFEYEVTDAIFTEVGVPPASFGFGPLDVFIPGIGVVATLDPGEFFDLSSFGISLFRLTGIDPLLDIEDPGLATAFPTFLDWDGDATTLSMTAITVPEPPDGIAGPPTALMVLTGLTVILARRRLRRSH